MKYGRPLGVKNKQSKYTCPTKRMWIRVNTTLAQRIKEFCFTNEIYIKDFVEASVKYYFHYINKKISNRSPGLTVNP